MSLRHVWCWGPGVMLAGCFLSTMCWGGRCWQLNERYYWPVTSTGGGDNTGHCYCERRSWDRQSPRRPGCKGLHSLIQSFMRFSWPGIKEASCGPAQMRQTEHSHVPKLPLPLLPGTPGGLEAGEAAAQPC